MDDSIAGSGSEASPPRPGATPPQAISERMQALMSRAEQEVAEQRQLQTLVAEVRHSLAQLQDDARRTAGSTTGLGERLEAVVRAVGAGAQVMQGIGNQVDRLLDLVTAQQQQLAALADALAARDADTSAFDTLHRRLDAVAGEVHADSAASLHALAERIDNAVIALAEALIRPRTGAPAPAEHAPEPAGTAAADEGGDAADADADAADAVDTVDAADDDADVPTTATMTMPVTATPWAGAAEPAEPAEPDEPDDTDDTPETDAEAAAPAADEDVYVEEAMPAATPDDAAVEDAADEDTADEDTADEDTVEGDDEPGEVPITGWSVDAPPEQSPSAWGWDADAAPAQTPGANDNADHDEHGDKRRPWWRPGG